MKSIKKIIFIIVSISSIECWAQDQAPVWASDPVIASADCSTLEYKDVLNFLTKYFYPTLGFSSEQDKAGSEMMESYAISTSLILRSQMCLAEALELKEITDNLRKEQALISSGTSMSKREIKKQRKLSASASAKIEEAALGIEELTPEQRKDFTLGATTYLAGSFSTSELFKHVKKYAEVTKKEVSSGGFLSGGMSSAFGKVKGVLGTANTIRVISGGMPEHVKNLIDNSKFLIEYSDQQEIELPEEATTSISQSVEWI
ncbi:hypothetical protein [Oceanicoccus sp. KOV_DT_Chl]|uniref:hypothetical protein n=1 Tax=Oceanicoccus sp. KOV_DT_Chl TaxID=1904639 RepID=UPI000C7E7E67|nr:hypothetical protein [Oceanicoccus sp. KOV_DT_Chl]